jgi:hypothetical protein
LIASENLRSDITSIKKALTNTDRANQVIATADSALGQVSSLLNDIRGLVTESANEGALSADQIAANQLQIDSSLEALNRIAQTTTFQGRKLLDGSLTSSLGRQALAREDCRSTRPTSAQPIRWRSTPPPRRDSHRRHSGGHGRHDTPACRSRAMGAASFDVTSPFDSDRLSVTRQVVRKAPDPTVSPVIFRRQYRWRREAVVL